MASLQDVLMAAAAQEKEQQMSPEEAALLYGTLGIGVGAAAGDIPQRVIGAIRSKPKTSGQAMKRMLTPGVRTKLAGLLGAGAAGVGAVLAANQPVQAATTLAKLQAGEDVSEEELRGVLENYYSNLGVA